MTELNVSIQREAAETRITLAGEVDISTSPDLERVVQSLDGNPRVVIDLDQVTFMDSSGLAGLIKLMTAAEEGGHSLRLICNNPPVLRLFQLASVEQLLHDPASPP